MSILLIQTQELSATQRDGESEGHETALLLAAKHDPHALSELYRLHYPAIARYIMRRVGQMSIAEDLVADVFLNMVRYLPRFRVGPTPFRAWLYRLATNRVNRWARWQRRRAWRQLQDDVCARNDQPRREEAAHVRAALLTLPLPNQTVLALHYLEAMRLEEIAAVVGCAVGTVKSRLARGRVMLRALLQEGEGVT
jgi:RNA polymerase sigma-70 factor (ECF subfamily)